MAQCTTQKWPALIEAKPEKDKQPPDIKKLLATWRGTDINDYSEQAIIGTCALALHLCKKSRHTRAGT